MNSLRSLRRISWPARSVVNLGIVRNLSLTSRLAFEYIVTSEPERGVGQGIYLYTADEDSSSV